jgi:hypothetical protein
VGGVGGWVGGCVGGGGVFGTGKQCNNVIVVFLPCCIHVNLNLNTRQHQNSIKNHDAEGKKIKTNVVFTDDCRISSTLLRLCTQRSDTALTGRLRLFFGFVFTHKRARTTLLFES